AGDFNGDGKVDLAAIISSQTDAIRVLLGNGAGSFGAQVFFDINNLPGGTPGYRTSPSAVAVVDFNADGRADLMTANQDGTLTVMLGEGNGQFKPAVSFLAGDSLSALATDDFDGDGRVDVAAAYNNLS